MIEILDLEKALKRIRLEDGSHTNPQDGLCVMEAVAYVAGEPHSDHPKCASTFLTDLAICLNDASGANVNRNELKKVIPDLLNTRDRNDTKRAWILINWTLNEYLPKTLKKINFNFSVRKDFIKRLVEFDSKNSKPKVYKFCTQLLDELETENLTYSLFADFVSVLEYLAPTYNTKNTTLWASEVWEDIISSETRPINTNTLKVFKAMCAVGKEQSND